MAVSLSDRHGLSSDVKRCRQMKLHERLGRDENLFARMDGIGCHSRSSAQAGTDCSSLPSSEECTNSCTDRTSNAGILCRLFTFAFSAETHNIAGDRIVLVAGFDTHQLQVQS